MRVKIGQEFDPRLGLLDFSGYERAATTRAAGNQMLGKAIGQAIQGYKAERDDEQTKRKLSKQIAGGKSSYILDYLGIDKDETKNISADEVYDLIKDQSAKEMNDIYKAFFLAEAKAKTELAKDSGADAAAANSLRKLIDNNKKLKVDDKNGVLLKGGKALGPGDPEFEQLKTDDGFLTLFPGYRGMTGGTYGGFEIVED
jgi:CRISPR/Cas system CSM-associated protein Csm2 small subunit